MPKDKYYVYFKDKGVIYKKEILFATCHYDFKFRNANAENTEEIIRQQVSGQKYHIYFTPSQHKLSNLGGALYISMQRRVDVITKNGEVIWNIFEGHANVKEWVNHYLENAK